jgi:hypothetical protein
MAAFVCPDRGIHSCNLCTLHLRFLSAGGLLCHLFPGCGTRHAADFPVVADHGHEKDGQDEAMVTEERAGH